MVFFETVDIANMMVTANPFHHPHGAYRSGMAERAEMTSHG